MGSAGREQPGPRPNEEQPEPRPNEEQQQAISALDGPVLVIAGPGTGKTQLLSLRAVNILRERDIAPRNLLCLTYTDAGARAMIRRLVAFMGSEAYGITVSTFHSFAAGIRARYPEYFSRSAFATPITSLQSAQLIDRLLRELPVDDPLYANPYQGVHVGLRHMQSFIAAFKRSGLAPEQFRAIMQQNLDYMVFLTQKTELFALVEGGTSKDKAHILPKLQSLIAHAPQIAPAELTRPVLDTPGIYLPYAQYLAQLFERTELIDSEGKNTKGFQELRDRLFPRDSTKLRYFADERICKKAFSAIALYEAYQQQLTERGLYDYDDMILDATWAIEHSAELKYRLQDQYRYLQVDEFQDTNGAQMRLIDLLCEGTARPNLLVVGDDDQAIMRFQGASVSYIKQFEDRYDTVRRIVLKKNYRSRPSLVDLGQKVAQQIELRSSASAGEKKLQAVQREETPWDGTIHCYPSREVQYHEVANRIQARIEAGFIAMSTHPGEEIAVIAPRHEPLRRLIPALKRLGIAFTYTYTTTVSQIASLQTLLVLLNFIARFAQARPGYAEARLPQLLVCRELELAPADYLGFAFEAKRKGLSRAWFEALGTSDNPRLRRLHGWLLELIAAAASQPVRHVLHLAAQPLVAFYQEHEANDPLTLIEFNYGLDALLRFVEGELGGADRGLSAPPMRLAHIIDCFEEADRLGVKIDVSLPVRRTGAITLTTAHSSKGLEFDLVYLLDTDDRSWHSSRESGGYLTRNLLFGPERDEDDARRLLFVALTRARYELELVRGEGDTVRELLDTVVEIEEKPPLEDIALQAAQSWEDCYRLDTAELQALARPDIENLRMSASRLNAFVDYRQGCENSREFIATHILRLPGEPSPFLEFGDAVHRFLEDYVTRVVLANDSSLASVVQACREHIAHLDFEDTELAHMQQRLSGIVETFIPRLDGWLEGQPVVEGWIEANLDDIPLVGACDLLVLDTAAQTVRIFDYKTAVKKPDAPSLGYIRQLQFYRLLIETSEEYRGWRLEYSADLYVEPMRELGYQLYEPLLFRTSDEELEHLKLLVRAVWWRIQNELFDTSAFEDSEHYAQVKPSRYNANGTVPARERPSVQSAYERWLIEEWEKAHG
ncbi:MAG: ATP-dependent helicase [Coriobacteriales bacterium]|nr:ATP-dependent helicase [Coriobacteriales bacterium]